MQSLKLKLSFASFNLLSLPFLQLQWHLHADLQCPMDSQDTGDPGHPAASAIRKTPEQCSRQSVRHQRAAPEARTAAMPARPQP